MNPAVGGIVEEVSDSHDFEADIRNGKEFNVVGQSFRRSEFPVDTLLAKDEAVRSIDGGDEVNSQIYYEEYGKGAEEKHPHRVEYFNFLKRRTPQKNLLKENGHFLRNERHLHETTTKITLLIYK